jgi:DNA-binding MarR family transcriptional regulator
VETSSGISVINRLLRKELLEEFDDPDDKRSKRVRLTDKGRTEYEATIPHILKVITIMAGGLTEAKKTQLASLLDELNTYHVARHKEAKGLTLDELLEQD